MRSSKSRSRSKSNRQRSLGNIVNRVFDSSGPEGKVRGTPQQIIDKYLALARDAQLSNDRVAEQNFLQHAEHYTRMLGEAQRELGREHELRQGQAGDGQNGGQNGQNGQNGGWGQGGYQGGGQGSGQGSGQGGERHAHRSRHEDRADRDRDRDAAAPRRAPAVGEDEADDGPGLVETPEARMDQVRSATMMPDLPPPEADAAAPAKKSRGTRKPRGKRGEGSEGGNEGGTGGGTGGGSGSGPATDNSADAAE